MFSIDIIKFDKIFIVQERCNTTLHRTSYQKEPDNVRDVTQHYTERDTKKNLTTITKVPKNSHMYF